MATKDEVTTKTRVTEMESEYDCFLLEPFLQDRVNHSKVKFQSYLMKYPSRQIRLASIERIPLSIRQFNLASHMKRGSQQGRCTLSRPDKNVQQPFTDSTP